MSKYVQANLASDERVVYETQLHRIIFISPLGFLTLGIVPLLQRMNSEFAVTNKRIIMKTGGLSLNISELSLDKVEAVNVSQGILGRILDYGSVNVTGSGGSRAEFNPIAHPLEFRRAIQQQ